MRLAAPRVARRHPVTLAAAALLALFMLAGGALSPYGPRQLDWSVASPAAPDLSHRHWLGTDALGRDAYARLVSGTRLSLAIALASAAVSVAIGAAMGIAAGLYGGTGGALLMRFVDLTAVVPQVFVVILVSVLVGRGPLGVLAGLAPLGWLPVARVMQAEAATVARQPYIEAVRAMGLSPGRVLVQHALPNLLGPLLACFALLLPQFVLIEGFVSFLGLGVQDPGSSLGLLLADGAAYLERAPWLLLGPALVLILLVGILNTATDALKERLSAP